MSIKGLRGGRRLPSEDITIENMVFWCSRARIILFAHESQAEAMRRIRVVNSRIIHYTMTPFLMEPGEQMPLTDVVIDGIRINAVGKGEIARLRPTVNQYMVLQKPGRIENIQFKNLDITTDNPASVFFHLEGADPEHMVKQVSFENIRINGKSAGDVAAMLRIHPFVSGVSIDGCPAGIIEQCNNATGEKNQTCFIMLTVWALLQSLGNANQGVRDVSRFNFDWKFEPGDQNNACLKTLGDSQ